MEEIRHMPALGLGDAGSCCRLDSVPATVITHAIPTPLLRAVHYAAGPCLLFTCLQNSVKDGL